MARKKPQADPVTKRLGDLSHSISQTLRLPSLNDNRLEGFAYYFRIVLPLYNSEGEHVFTDQILNELFRVLDDRFGGFMVASSNSAPPLWGLWHPPSEKQPEKDYLTTVEVFGNPIEPTNRFFAGMKPLLKTAGQIDQQEILIQRNECWLM